MEGSRPKPRFVPTLTEVVKPGTSMAEKTPVGTNPIATPTIVPPALEVPEMDTERLAQGLAQEVMQLVLPKMEQHLRTTLLATVEVQMHKIRSQWQIEIQRLATEAVKQALQKSR